MLLVRAPRLNLPPLPSSRTFALPSSSIPALSPLSFSSSSKPFRVLRVQFPSLSSSPLSQIKPFVLAEWEPILKGWICSAVSVCCLSVAVPLIGKLPSILSAVETERMVRDCLALTFLVSARSAVNYLQQAFLWEAALGTAFRIRAYVFGQVLQRDIGFFEGIAGEQTGDIAHRLTSEASVVADMMHSVLNVLPSILFVKASNGELNGKLRFQRLALSDQMAHLRKKRMKAFIPQFLQIIYVGGLIILSATWVYISKKSIDGARFFSFAMSLALLIDPIQGIGKAFNELKEGEPAVERLFDLAQHDCKVVDKPNAIELCKVMGDIKFCGVTFRYADNMPFVLNGVDVHIKSGERVAFIGRSGEGKTTLVKLLLRFYDPLHGHIFLDNQDIQDVTVRSLREHIVLLPQDIMLFSGTVAENIGYKDSAGRVDMECVENAARIANADGFIRELLHGYETNVGPRGSLLSGGQKQRIALARALYYKSAVLILDEATSALDCRSELMVRMERLITMSLWL